MRFDRRISFRCALLTSAIALATFATGAPAQTYNFRVLHVFSAPRDGKISIDGVRFDAAGNLYGATRNGGAYTGNGDGAGTIFKIAKDGTETIVHSFDGAAGGDQPLGGVTIDPATGDLFGTTGFGGSASACPYPFGCGVLYKQTVGGTYTVLHNFDGGHDGAEPGGRLVRDPQGNLYGTTSSGGANSLYGTIFKYGADGSFTVLHDFEGSPEFFGGNGGLIRDRGGNLYGVSLNNRTGMIYKLALDGSFTTLYSFTGGADGEDPRDPLTGDEAGNLYGTTSSTVFKLAPDGTLTTLYTFTGGADGDDPNGDLLRIGGDLYGTAFRGGNPDCSGNDGCGVVFKLAADGTETVLHAFGPREVGPSSGLDPQYGRLFGTTATVGGFSIEPRPGTVYSIGVATQ